MSLTAKSVMGMVPSMLLLVAMVSIGTATLQAQDARTIAALRAAAEKGDAQAQLDYAKAIKNAPESRDWAMKAAQQGLPEAWFWLGSTSTGDQSLSFYEKAAETGYARAFPDVMDGLLFRAGEKADVAKAKTFADLARSLGITELDAKDLETADRCALAGRPQIPIGERVTPLEIKTFDNVDCDLVLAGVGQAADSMKYGRCVLAEDPLDPHRAAEVFANGYGVKRNAMTAIAFLCHSSDVPAELHAMVDVLFTTRAAARLETPFAFCDHVTSGFNQGNCAMRADAIDTARREALVASLTSGWPPAHKAALEALLSAAENFFKTHSGSELDMSGTARVAIAIDEESRLQQELIDDLRAFDAGKLPPKIDLKAADAELNAVYRQILGKKNLDLGTVTKEDIRNTQKEWLRLRDAWAAFGVLRYPALTADEWKAWATRNRVGQLKELLKG